MGPMPPRAAPRGARVRGLPRPIRRPSPGEELAATRVRPPVRRLRGRARLADAEPPPRPPPPPQPPPPPPPPPPRRTPACPASRLPAWLAAPLLGLGPPIARFACRHAEPPSPTGLTTARSSPGPSSSPPRIPCF